VVDLQVQQDRQAELEQLDQQVYADLLVHQVQQARLALPQLLQVQQAQQVRRERQSMFAEALQP
jgi:hypothetical protein